MMPWDVGARTYPLSSCKPNESFPYNWISRMYCVSYSAVLELVDLLEQCDDFTDPHLFPLDKDLYERRIIWEDEAKAKLEHADVPKAIIQAYDAEKERRRQVK